MLRRETVVDGHHDRADLGTDAARVLEVRARGAAGDPAAAVEVDDGRGAGRGRAEHPHRNAGDFEV
jgi:hypothetical protein